MKRWVTADNTATGLRLDCVGETPTTVGELHVPPRMPTTQHAALVSQALFFPATTSSHSARTIGATCPPCCNPSSSSPSPSALAQSCSLDCAPVPSLDALEESVHPCDRRSPDGFDEPATLGTSSAPPLLLLSTEPSGGISIVHGTHPPR